MKTIINSLVTLILLLAAEQSFAQLSRMESAIDEGNFKRLVKLGEKYVEDPELKKQPMVYYYYAQGLLELSKDPSWMESYPKSVSDAIKLVNKGLRYDTDSSLFIENQDLMDALASRQNEMALEQYNINKYSKALKLYEMSYELNRNREARNMMAKNALLSGDTALAQHIYKELVALYQSDLDNEEDGAVQELDAHIYFINKYWETKNYDSANWYLDHARLVFGNEDARIGFYQKNIGLEQISGMPPSSLMMEYIKKNLRYFPTDSNFLHKENALYVFMIKNQINGGDLNEADTLLSKFCKEKVERSSHELVTDIMENDIFVAKKESHVLWKLAEYYQTYDHPKSADYVLNKYIVSTADDTTEEAIAKRWLVISDYAFKTKEFPFAAYVLQQSIIKSNNAEELLILRAKTVSAKSAETLDVVDQGALYMLAKEIYEYDPSGQNLEQLEVIGERYIQLLIKNQNFSKIVLVLGYLEKVQPDKDYSEIEKEIAREDFYINYFHTKTKGKDENGQPIDLFDWNGNISKCDAGSVSPLVQQKVLDRINYFRRAAGVPEVYFDPELNQYCQEAALMLTVNKKLDHQPPTNWRCYTNDGAYAANKGILTAGSNTSIAVTSSMADLSNTGSRASLLYPYNIRFGHGSTELNAVIFADIDSTKADTSYYTSNPICWPPKGYIPQMMVFSNWTFAIHQNLDGAKVEVKLNGKNIPVKVEKPSYNYGIPYLSFTPQFDQTKLGMESTFEVSVTLSDGSNYSYSVIVFEYDPNKS